MNAPVHPTTFDVLAAATRALTGRQMLEAQRDQLADAIAKGNDPFELNMARRLHQRAIDWLAMPDKPLDRACGLFGENGWQPGVDRVCAMLLASADKPMEQDAPAEDRAPDASIVLFYSVNDDFRAAVQEHAAIESDKARERLEQNQRAYWARQDAVRFTTPVATPLGTAFVDAGL